MKYPERDGDRAATRSAVLNHDFLSRKDTAQARLEAAMAGLVAGVLYSEWNRTFTSQAAITLIEAAMFDLGMVA